MTLAKKHLLFGAYLLLLIAASLPALRALVELSMRDMSASHLILVPFVTAVLIFQERDRVFVAGNFPSLAGVGVIAAGLALLGAASVYRPSPGFDDTLSLQMSAVVVLAIGGFVLFYGTSAARRALFPLCFLVFTIPIPDAVLAPVVSFLKRGSTEMSAWLFTATGTTYYREGFVFALPTVTIEVADACSGIRSSIALLLTTLLAGHMFLEKPWTKALLVLAILPITLFKNAIRIVGLTLLAIHVDPSFLTGQLHHEGGILFFLMALAMLAPILALLRRAEVVRADDRARAIV
jgi:exosortase